MMETISTIPGKLLFFTHYLHCSRKISSKEKRILKDMIIGQNQEVINAYYEYEKLGTELTLTSTLKRLALQQKDKETDEGTSKESRKVKRRHFKIIIPARNIQKLPGAQERI